MESIAVQAARLRAVEAARAQEREATLAVREAQANEMLRQGADLRQFADAKFDGLRAELATNAQTEVSSRHALASGNQRFTEQVRRLQSALVSPTYLSVPQRRQIKGSYGPVTMQTAGGEATALGSVDVWI